MNAREWGIEYRRDVISLSTMLAHPEGSNPWLQSRQVLDEIADVYPDVWSYTEQLDQRRRRSRFSVLVSPNSRALKERCPIAVYQILVALGRGDLSELQAMEKIARGIS